MKPNEVSEVFETVPNEVYGISSNDIKTTPNEVYGLI